MSLKFGKYKGKTFEHVYRKDKGYCSWFVENCKKGKCANAFKDYILQRGLYNKKEVFKKSVNATKLASKISLDPDVIKFLGEFTLCKELFKDEEDSDEDVEWKDLPHWVSPDEPIVAIPRKNITAQLYGQFVDFYVRFKIANYLGIKFQDKSVEKVIKKNIPGCKIIENAYTEQKKHSDILKCAVSATLSRGSKKDVSALSKNFCLSDEVVNRVDTFINGMDHEGVLLNPDISFGLISAHADIITENGIIDIKTGKDNINYYLSQLMIYAVLYKNKYSKEVKTITVFNPVSENNTIVNINISKEQFEFFEKYLLELELF